MPFLFWIEWIIPTPKYSCILNNKGKSLLLNSIAKVGIIDQPDLYDLFLVKDTKKEDSPSENPVTQLGWRLAGFDELTGASVE